MMYDGFMCPKGMDGLIIYPDGKHFFDLHEEWFKTNHYYHYAKHYEVRKKIDPARQIKIYYAKKGKKLYWAIKFHLYSYVFVEPINEPITLEDVNIIAPLIFQAIRYRLELTPDEVFALRNDVKHPYFICVGFKTENYQKDYKEAMSEYFLKFFQDIHRNALEKCLNKLNTYQETLKKYLAK